MFRRIIPFIAIVAVLLVEARAATPAAAPTFNRDIRPILSDACFQCHGPDKSHRKADLRLDDRAMALQTKAIVPGKPEESELIKRIFSKDPEEQMPPAEAHKKLTEAQKDLFRRWVAAGAAYEPHWAYLAPKRPGSPEVKNKTWVRTPVDAFILRALEGQNVTPAPEADRRTLLRRLSLDLTGLPPTPADLRAFLADSEPGAYERQVERLLASPHYGERMAVPWLDIVRFADTVGYHGDQNQNIFPYRDYVISAFNRNKPFNEFTIEQLAGDLLPNPTVEQRIATGFNRLNMMTREGGAQPKEYLAKYAADRVRTVSTAWLGSTMACAECHDHKFDPFSTKDFYAMSAFFADVKQWGVYSDYKYTPNPDLKGWNNDYPFPPELEVPSEYLQQRRDRFRQEISALIQKTVDDAALEIWLPTARAWLEQNPDGWDAPTPDVKSQGSNYWITSDRAIVFTGEDGKDQTYTIRLPLEPGVVSAIRVELLPQATNQGNIYRGGKAQSFQLTARIKGDGEERKLSVLHAEATAAETNYSNGSALLGVQRGWRVPPADTSRAQSSVWLLDAPIRVTSADRLIITLKAHSFGSIRISTTPLGAIAPLASGADESLKAALGAKKEARNAAQLERLRQTCFLAQPRADEVTASYRKLHDALVECRDGKAQTLVTVAWEPTVARVLPRGNWQDETGEVVMPAVPHFLPGPKSGTNRLSRLDLARWLVSPENPLTARTMVNRLWKQFFGAGLCSTLDDLGLQSEAPSHPELLDWLAVEFQENGWDVKKIVRQIVLSAAYRQSSNLRPERLDADPANRLLASQNPRRLESEFVRDNALAIAGLLNGEIGGPSAHPYQPAGYYANLQFPDRDYQADTNDQQYRRGVYTHWQRTFLHPMLANFDAPSREECTAQRTVSNTPQQALTLLNDPSFVEAARIFAQQALEVDTASDTTRIQWVFERALNRPAKGREVASLLNFLKTQRDHSNEHGGEASKLLQVGLAPAESGNSAELAAWTSLCRVVLNLHETISVY